MKANKKQHFLGIGIFREKDKKKMKAIRLKNQKHKNINHSN